jgi:hypothetical protein
MIYKIMYDVKMTSANTTYYNISEEDKNYLLNKLIQINSYMGEISLTKKQDIKDLIRWYTKPNKSLPYSRPWKRYNSPQSFISGTLNNLLYGTTKDISDVSAAHLENIISLFCQLTEAVDEEEKRKIQISADNDSIMFQENLWELK